MVTAVGLKPRNGFSLVEIAMVLAIAALILAAVMLFFNNASTNQRVQDSVAEVSTIAAVVRSLYAGQSDYSAVTTAAVALSGQMPSKWVSGTANNRIAHPFFDQIKLVQSGGTFGIVFNNMPYAACSQMSTLDFGTGSAYTLVNGATAQYGKPYSPTSALTSCVSTQNQMQFGLY